VRLDTEAEVQPESSCRDSDGASRATGRAVAWLRRTTPLGVHDQAVQYPFGLRLLPIGIAGRHDPSTEALEDPATHQAVPARDRETEAVLDEGEVGQHPTLAGARKAGEVQDRGGAYMAGGYPALAPDLHHCYPLALRALRYSDPDPACLQARSARRGRPIEVVAFCDLNDHAK